MTPSKLFLQALKLPANPGEHTCFYDSEPCDESLAAKEFVKGSFTGWAGVANPSSGFVCAGCVATMNELADITVGGEARDGQKVRNYSWVITTVSAEAFTKAHIAEIRGYCLNPPKPPYVIVIADSGQKQLLYRAPVCVDVNSPVVMLEDEPVSYSIPALRQMLELCGKLIAATGKPPLKEPLNVSTTRFILECWPDEGEELINRWQRVSASPLARLALWLSDSKESQRRTYGMD